MKLPFFSQPKNQNSIIEVGTEKSGTILLLQLGGLTVRETIELERANYRFFSFRLKVLEFAQKISVENNKTLEEALSFLEDPLSNIELLANYRPNLEGILEDQQVQNFALSEVTTIIKNRFVDPITKEIGFNDWQECMTEALPQDLFLAIKAFIEQEKAAQTNETEGKQPPKISGNTSTKKSTGSRSSGKSKIAE